VLEAFDLHKTYIRPIRARGAFAAVRDLLQPRTEAIPALSGISLALAPGRCLGLLGPNGAGKSTLIKILAGILFPDSGRVAIDGIQPGQGGYQYQKSIGVVFGQRSRLVWDLSVREAMQLFRVLYEVPQERFGMDVDTLAGCFELEKLMDVPIRNLSLGQKMRCELACALLPRPKVLLLDEPTHGLDTVARFSLRGVLNHLKTSFGTAILMASHDLHDIQHLADSLMVIDHGRQIYSGTADQLVDAYGTGYGVTIDVEDPEVLQLPGWTRKGHQLSAKSLDLPLIAGILNEVASHTRILEVRLKPPALEEALVRLYDHA
jgi:ABC-2 type transport system ATP-binding protein